MARETRRPRKKSAAPLGGAPARRGGLWLALVLGGLVVVNLYVFLWRKGTSVPDVAAKAEVAAIVGGNPVAGGPDAAAPETPAVPTAPTAPAATTGVVERGDSLGKLLRRLGLSGEDASAVMRALQPILDFRTIRAGAPYRLERDATGRIVRFEYEVSRTHRVRAERGANGEFVGVTDQATTRIEVRELGAKIDRSLHAAIKGAGEDGALVAFFVDVFAYDLDFYNDTHGGDTVRVIVEKEYAGDAFIRYRRILAAEYQGKAGTFGAYYWEAPGAKPGAGRYYTAKGESLEQTMLKTPLKYARVSSKFDRKRMHPVLHRTRAHLGIDYAAPTGTPVWAAAPGTIVSRGPAGGAGNMVVIKHDAGLATVYMHLSKFAPGQKVGDRVAAKTVIGAVGTTGLSTGPHLHFGVKLNGSFVDPSTLTPRRNAGVAKAHLAAFRAHAAGLAARMAAVPIGVAPEPEDDDEGALGAGDGGPVAQAAAR